MNIKAVFADADGTVIENNNLSSLLPELKEAIKQLRVEGILFNLASGRSYHSLKVLYHHLIAPEQPKLLEGIVYEASAVRLFGRQEHHVLGKFSAVQKREIMAHAEEKNLFSGLILSRLNKLYLSYLTPAFLYGKGTDKILLQEKFQEAKMVLEHRFPYLRVMRSADAVDITVKGITKANAVRKYSELTGLIFSRMAAIGDSGNDLPMFEVVGKNRGLVIYVGKNPEEEKIVREYEHHFIPQFPGPLGTVQGIGYILEKNNIERNNEPI